MIPSLVGTINQNCDPPQSTSRDYYWQRRSGYDFDWLSCLDEKIYNAACGVECAEGAKDVMGWDVIGITCGFDDMTV